MSTLTKYLRRVIRITAEDSPNVAYARAEQARGLKPSNRTVIPGVLTWQEYTERRLMWDKIRQCVGLDAQFYEGAEVKMFPGVWLERARELYSQARPGRTRQAEGIGCDPAEGGDSTTLAAVDRYGLIEGISVKTPDTAEIRKLVINFAGKHKVPWNRICFDRGGGGKQHADYMREKGMAVRTVAFGAPPMLDLKRFKHLYRDRADVKEDRYTYINRRGEMYDTLRQLLNPANEGWSLPPGEYTDELERQLKPIPLMYDKEGRFYVLPKRRHDKDANNPDKREPTLIDLVGHSPDETDAVLLALYAMRYNPVVYDLAVDN